MGAAGKLLKQEERASGGSDAHSAMVGISFWMSTYDTALRDSGKPMTFKNTLAPNHHTEGRDKELAKVIFA